MLRVTGFVLRVKNLKPIPATRDAQLVTTFIFSISEASLMITKNTSNSHKL